MLKKQVNFLGIPLNDPNTSITTPINEVATIELEFFVDKVILSFGGRTITNKVIELFKAINNTID